MHDWDHVTSNGFVAIFRRMEGLIRLLGKREPLCHNWRNDMLRAGMMPGIRLQPIIAGGFGAQYSRSCDRPRIPRGAGGDAGRLGAAGRNPRAKADPGVAGWAQGSGGADRRRPQWRGDGPRRQMLHLQQWWVFLDTLARRADAGRAGAASIYR